jgi:hypothetical protein
MSPRISILEAFPYPWSRAEAQQLHRALSQLYPSSQAAMLAAQRSGIRTSGIFWQQAPLLVWKEILDEAAAAGLTRALVQDSHDELQPSSPLRPFIEDLLAGRRPSSGG